jgi:hypothetical protein
MPVFRRGSALPGSFASILAICVLSESARDCANFLRRASRAHHGERRLLRRVTILGEKPV